ncbi:probable meiotically up-regulated gene 161 protein [Phialocephala subalpina]|uniref:Probable meiotically up-regulated gene 161 protein n=1 Tax=Phialocephala subalpina TaxID=576137 RepID=A0A1L7WBR6_9HELO|nr:probable meiotically up-regulated gene 161 protein [Phialocephala subalpina]
MASKLIVLGAVNGQLKSAFTKLSTLHTKNSFSFAIVVGNLFAEDDDAVSELLAGSIAVPLPTYFTVGTSPLPARINEKIKKDEEICPNLHFLGKRSTTKTSEGVRIVALGGQLDETIVGGTSQEQHLPFHTIGDAKALHGANTTDILLTTSWPASIRTGSKVVIPVGATLPPKGQEYISDLCATLKPRYHFSASPDFFYEREPFFHAATKDAPDVRPFTRFISLAPYGNPMKAKAIYAFSLQHSPDFSAPFPAGTTSSPFTSNSTPKKRAALDPEPYSRYGNTDSYRPRRNKGAHGGRRPPPGPGECFFCLSNPTLATHLISSIGDDAYLTIAKGPLTTADTNAALGIDFPAHALIIPLTHSPTLAVITEEDNARQKTFAEMTKFREALQKMVSKRSDGKLGAVTYEISKASGVHTHWQFVPMPIETIQKGLVEAAFRVEAENLKYPDFEVRDPGIGQDDGDFFRVWVWTPPSEAAAEGTTKCLTMAFDDYLRFSLQFGRIVLAKLLGLEKRIQWRDCAQTEDEEKKDIEAFKAAFKDFDFTLE